VSFAQIKVGDYDGLVIAKGRAREYLGLNQDLMDMTFKFQSLRML
jgi:putative intracellular protease/amidase